MSKSKEGFNDKNQIQPVLGTARSDTENVSPTNFKVDDTGVQHMPPNL